MTHAEMKKIFGDCSLVSQLDDIAKALLFWHAEERLLEPGEVLYREGDRLDHSFCLFLSGELQAEKNGAVDGELFGQQVIGEMAYFTNHHTRTATIRAGANGATLLRFSFTPIELSTPRFASIRNWLRKQTWNRLLSQSRLLA